MLGEISPHHEYYDSKSSTETPPSYNQLNYNENIERFFKSKPSIAMYGSDEETLNLGNDEGGKTNPTSAARKYMSPINGSGASGSGSAENLSSSSNNLPNSERKDNTSNTTNSNTTATTESFKQSTLTESLLNRHNEDMEKMMMQKHRELRSNIKNNDKLKDVRIKAPIEKMSVDQNNHYVGQCHGVKRSGSHSWERDSFKVSKQDEVSRASNAGPLPTNVATTIASMSIEQASAVFQTNGNINVWPPLSVTVPSETPVLPCITQNVNCQAIPRIPHMIPVYYVPVPQPIDAPIPTAKYPQPPTNVTPSSIPMAQQSPYMFVPVSYVATAMPGVMYPPVIGTSTPGTMMYRPFLIPEQAPMPQENAKPMDKCMDKNRLASQATGIKAKPADSITTMSELSKKVLSPGKLFSSCISNDGGGSSVVNLPTSINNKQHKNIDYNSDESSSSSFYSSLLYKSSESNCNPDQKITEQVAENSQQAAKVKHAIQRKNPPWLEGVQLTPELIYEYQLHPKTLNEVLESDMDTLKKISQPLLVNEQLSQLYFDLELEGFGTKLMIEEGITSSESDSGSSNGSWIGFTSQKPKSLYI